MRKLLFILIAFMFAACAGDVSVPANIIDNMPAAVPQLPANAQFLPSAFTQKVSICFTGSGVQLSQLPAGVTAATDGANVTLRSSLAGVEYVVEGSSANGSLTIVSERSLLLTLDTVNLRSVGREALAVSSRETIFLNGSRAVFTDAATAQAVADKQAAAVVFMGNAVLCGNLEMNVSGTRRDAIRSTAILYVDGASVAVDYAAASAVNATNGVVVAAGNLVATSQKDVVKVKQGNLVMLGGCVTLGAAAEKADAVQAKNIYLFDGVLTADVQGAAAKGLKTKESAFLLGGELKVHTSGGALFSEKKSDYSSAACIKSDLNVYIKNANVSLVSDGDAGKGINCDGRLQIDGGVVSIKTTGADVNHPVDLNAHASPKGIKCDSTLLVKGGCIEVVVLGKGERCEGVESKGRIIIDGDAEFYIYATDDAVNSGADFIMNGGKLYAYSVNNDGIDSNGGVYINGGTIIANGTHTPEQGIDTDDESRYIVNGGTLLTYGGSFGPSPCMPKGKDTGAAVVAWCGVDATKGSFLNVTGNDGKTVLSYRIPRSMKNASFVVASPAIEKGGNYSFFFSDTVEGGSLVGCGLYEGATAAGSAVVDWKQQALLAILEKDGKATYINPDTLKQVGGHFGFPPPGDGKFPGDFPPPPPGGKFPGGKMPAGFPPMPPGGKIPGGFPPPPAGGFPPFESMPDDGNYSANNLPGKGW